MYTPSIKTITALSLFVAAASYAQIPAGLSASVGIDNGVLVDEGGMTLYIFDKDMTPGKSTCNEQCAINWPPLSASSSDQVAGDWNIITRDDGQKQWAYKGKPLYTWSKDKKPGDRTGDGMANAWHLATP